MKKTPFILYGVGIDVSKKDLHVYFLAKAASDEIKIRGKRKFSNSSSGIKDLILWLEKKRQDKTLELRIYLEATGVYHERALFGLTDSGYSVSLLLGRRVKAYGKSLGEDSKNDDRDSYTLGHMALSRKERVWKPLSKHILAIRSVMRLRRALIKNRVACQNQLHAAHYSLSASAFVSQTLIETIEQINAQIDLLESKALELAREDEALIEKMNVIIESIKGVGMISLLEIIGETNGFSEFRSIKQLVNYAGLDIIENQSGAVAGKTRISKKGNARIRAALYMQALTIVRKKNKAFFPLYERVRERNPKIKKKAIVAVQRKLLGILFVLWKKGQAFDPNYQWNAGIKPKMEVALK